MAGVSSTQPLVPSLLDRLIEPSSGRERSAGAGGDTHMLRDSKQSVRRDLENLLNTRWRCKVWPPDLAELEVSPPPGRAPLAITVEFSTGDRRTFTAAVPVSPRKVRTGSKVTGPGASGHRPWRW